MLADPALCPDGQRDFREQLLEQDECGRLAHPSTGLVALRDDTVETEVRGEPGLLHGGHLEPQLDVGGAQQVGPAAQQTGSGRSEHRQPDGWAQRGGDRVGRGLVARIEPDPAAVATEPGERAHRVHGELRVTGHGAVHDADRSGPAGSDRDRGVDEPWQCHGGELERHGFAPSVMGRCGFPHVRWLFRDRRGSPSPHREWANRVQATALASEPSLATRDRPRSVTRPC